MRHAEIMGLVLVALVAGGTGCKRPEASKPTPPATVAGKKPEGEISRVTLTPEAEARLGLTLGAAILKPSAHSRNLGGDVLPSSGRSILLVAPVAGRLSLIGKSGPNVGQAVKRGDPLIHLTPVAGVDRDLKATSERAVSIAESRLAAMEARLARADKLLKDGAGSARAAEEARADRDTAKAELDAAKSRVGMLKSSPLDSDIAVTLRAPEDGVVRVLSAPPSSMVPAGAPLLEIVGTGSLWVRVNVFVGDLRAIRLASGVHVRGLTAPPSQADLEALPVSGPPTADPLTSSFDLYYALPKEASFRPGERVSVTVPYGTDSPALHVPESAIVRDVAGTAWVYVPAGPHVYERVRVEVERVGTEGARLSRGLAAGTQVVSVGASELFGAEFGTGK